MLTLYFIASLTIGLVVTLIAYGYRGGVIKLRDIEIERINKELGRARSAVRCCQEMTAIWEAENGILEAEILQ